MSHRTPGPWRVSGPYVEAPSKDRRGRTKYYVVASVSSPGANQIHEITGGYGDYEQAKQIQESNARLIAAAPELLDALERVLATIDDEADRAFPWPAEFREHSLAYRLAREAIAKATPARAFFYPGTGD